MPAPLGEPGWMLATTVANDDCVVNYRSVGGVDRRPAERRGRSPVGGVA